jgi:hypothetical protein
VAGIESLIPNASKTDVAGLREIDADELARYVADKSHPWWRRRHCVEALAGRVPEARVPELLSRIRDCGDVGQVRIALLDLLGHRQELLAWLRHDDRAGETSIQVPEAVLKARGMAGDLAAAGELATLANDSWRHRREKGQAGLDALVARYGLEAVGEALGERPEDRAFRVRMRHRAGQDVTDALADPDVGVAHLVHTLARDEGALRAHLRRAQTVDSGLWAALALYNLAGDLEEIRAIYDALGRPRVEVAGLDEELRAAIVHQYAPRCTERTDPRWRMEGICAEAPQPPDMDGQLRDATAALAAAGLAPGPPVYCRDYHKQGRGTYHVIDYQGGTVCVSTLGRFAGSMTASPAGIAALKAADFRWIDEPLGAITVTGLCVYYFGDRKPLDVYSLLLYWQD